MSDIKMQKHQMKDKSLTCKKLKIDEDLVSFITSPLRILAGTVRLLGNIFSFPLNFDEEESRISSETNHKKGCSLGKGKGDAS